MVLIRDIIVNNLLPLIASLMSYQAVVMPPPEDLLQYAGGAIMVVALTVWLASGCWAGSIAGARRHSIVGHFFLGLLVPYVYPFFCLFAMDIRGAKERARARKEEQEKAEQERQMRERAAEMEKAEQLAAGKGGTGPSYDADHFQEIMLDENGNPTGPWVIGFGETVVHAQRICEAMPTLVVVEIADNTGQTQRLRIPYNKITSCSPID
jgi:hypothetical protein